MEVIEIQHGITVADNFAPFRKQAAEWMEKAKDIQVTSSDQTELMQEARKARLALRQIRVSSEKLKDELKEEYLRKGKEIQTVYNEIKNLVEPIEDYLQKQEDFEKVERQKRNEIIFNERYELLKPYMGEEAKKMALAELSEDVFNSVLLGQKAALEQRKQNEEQSRLAYIQTQRKEKEEREALKLEAERANAERKIWVERVNQLTTIGMQWNPAFESYGHPSLSSVTMAEIKELPDEQWQIQFKIAAETVSEYNRKEQLILKNQKEKLEKERATRKALEKEIADREAQEEADRKAEAAAKRKAARAPDREKLERIRQQLIDFAKDLPHATPKYFSTKEAQVTMEGVHQRMVNTIGYINDQLSAD